ncbi:MAG TPA: antitoxin MazE-like protein [Xanthobacteraceae bacterium]|nr:antitoxin MazE-like protein [Xanthobacteraceae bacterium]
MKPKSRRPIAQMRAKASVRKAKPKVSSAAKHTRAKSSREKVRAYRERMRAKGLRLVQMWVPDTLTPDGAGGADRQSLRARRRASAAIRKAWAKALTPLPPGHVPTFADIAHLVGSVDGLPSDLSTRKKYYLKLYGYGRKRSR